MSLVRKLPLLFLWSFWRAFLPVHRRNWFLFSLRYEVIDEEPDDDGGTGQRSFLLNSHPCTQFSVIRLLDACRSKTWTVSTKMWVLINLLTWLWGLQDVQVTSLMYHSFPKEDWSLHCSRFRPWIAGPGSLSGDNCIVQSISCWASSQGKHFLYILSLRGWLWVEYEISIIHAITSLSLVSSFPFYLDSRNKSPRIEVLIIRNKCQV